MKLVDPIDLQISGNCNVRWNATDVLETTIVAMGVKSEMIKAEKEQLMNIENKDEQQPPSKKKKTEPGRKRGKTREPLAPIQAVRYKYYIVNIIRMYIHAHLYTLI